MVWAYRWWLTWEVMVHSGLTQWVTESSGAKMFHAWKTNKHDSDHANNHDNNTHVLVNITCNKIALYTLTCDDVIMLSSEKQV